jgi:hypothetical protein
MRSPAPLNVVVGDPGRLHHAGSGTRTCAERRANRRRRSTTSTVSPQAIAAHAHGVDSAEVADGCAIDETPTRTGIAVPAATPIHRPGRAVEPIAAPNQATAAARAIPKWKLSGGSAGANCCRSSSKAYQARGTLHVEPPLSDERFPAAVETTVYLACQELVEAADRQHATAVSVRLWRDNGSLAFAVNHDAPTGIRASADRVAALGGELRTEVLPTGTRVTGTVPLTA